MIGMVQNPPPEAQGVLGSYARVVIPSLVIPVDRAGPIRDPGELRDGVRHVAEPFLALPQLLLRPAPQGGVHSNQPDAGDAVPRAAAAVAQREEAHLQEARLLRLTRPADLHLDIRSCLAFGEHGLQRRLDLRPRLGQQGAEVLADLDAERALGHLRECRVGLAQMQVPVQEAEAHRGVLQDILQDLARDALRPAPGEGVGTKSQAGQENETQRDGGEQVPPGRILLPNALLPALRLRR